jgi:hypothetical protein
MGIMRQHCIIGALLASALVMSGCGQTEENAATTNEAANVQTEADAPLESPAENATASEGVMTAGTTQQDFAIVNNSGRTVTRLTNSIANEDDWGIDMLRMEPLPDGGTAQVSLGRGADQCLWDFRATFDGGETRDWRSVNLCEVSSVTLTPS